MNSAPFAEDDYATVQEKYFSGLWAKGCVDADPSGWALTYSEAEQFLRLPRMRPQQFAGYYVDEGSSLARYKDRLIALLSAWEGRKLCAEEFTLCPSGACASLVTLSALKSLGVKHIIFETPAYFATIEQAAEIGLRYKLLPTYRKSDYELHDLGNLTRVPQVALWLTHPRAALGFNQSINSIVRLFKQAGKRSFLVSDEVTDQSFPAHLNTLHESISNANLIRIRSFTKGMGLNGLRLATIMHSPQLRTCLVNSLESFGGSIDAHSLVAITNLAEDLPRFRSMLAAANTQVNHLRAKAERLTTGSSIAVNHLTNGYIGSMVADLSALGRTQRQRKTRLLKWCSKMCTPIMLGNTFYMAKDEPTEAIRLNFFNRPENIIRGITNILGLWQTS